jgi:hypothetical protein
MKGRKDNGSPIDEGLLIAEFGHELGNVLNGLLGMTRLVRRSELNAEQDRWLRAIEQSGRQLRRLVEAFRREPDLPSRSVPAQPKLINGVDLLEQALLSHAPAARDGDNRLLLTVAAEVPRKWRVDPCLLRQLIDNLLGNALKFTAAGEVVLEAARAPCDGGDTGTLVLTVVDSGPGLDAELGRRMFRAYQRGPDQVRDKSAGYGLGLFICKRIVQSLGGEIGWSTPASGGARFAARLPAVLTAGSAPAPLPSRLMRMLECRLELTGQVHRSVAGCLSRLGVPWRLAGDEKPAGAGQPAADSRVVSIVELPSATGRPGPLLRLQAETTDGRVIACRNLQAPILESNLGPLLMELMLQATWIRNARLGSVP